MDKLAPLKTPIALIVFNRPETTRRVFERIRRVKPAKLLIIADGPRDEIEGEQQRCHQTREIVSDVDWDCDLRTNLSDKNLGCRKRISSGLDWVFAETERAIILEDDCLPDVSFFGYCEALLDRYAQDDRVMSIRGSNFVENSIETNYSYFFSRYEACWGWASWRRAWKHFDVDISLWPLARDQELLSQLFESRQVVDYWRDIFERLYRKEVDSWAYGWSFAHLVQNGLAIVPRKNLISNIGFGPEASHTRSQNSFLSNLDSGSLRFPLKHPPFVVRHRSADAVHEKVFMKSPTRAIRAALRGTRELRNRLHKKARELVTR